MATDPARITTPERTPEDADAALRPKSLEQFISQQGALVPLTLRKAAK
jgi:Holliday junction DNA helicase RuvB